MRVRVCQGGSARPGRPSGRRRADHTRCIGSHYLSPGPVSVRMCPAVHGVLDAGVVPASQPAGRGAVSGIRRTLWLVLFLSSSRGCIDKCIIVVSLYLVSCCALINASSWLAVGPARWPGFWYLVHRI